MKSEPRVVAGSLKRRTAEPLRKPPVKKPEPKIAPAQRPPSPAPAAPSPPSPARPPAAPAGPPPGHCELNPFMTRALNVELQDIMIKVWQALPDDPNTDAEKYAAEKLKADTGDDIINVLGLNVAKRLLNIFNPLNVKIHFSNIPQRAYLRSFLKKYSFISFKRVERSTKTFAATLKTIQDFDRLCTANDLRCGSSKVTVSPNYKFTHCPSKLKAIEKIESSKERIKIQGTSNKEVNSEDKSLNDNIKTNAKQENVKATETHIGASINSKPTQVVTVTTSKTQNQNPQAKPEPKPQIKNETNVNSKQLPKPEVQNLQTKQTTVTTAQAQNLSAKQVTNTKGQNQNSQVTPPGQNKSQEQRPQRKTTVTTSQQGQNSHVKQTDNTKPQDQSSQVNATSTNEPTGQTTSPQVKPPVNTLTGNSNAGTKQQTEKPQEKPTANKQQTQGPQVTPTANKQQAQSQQVKPTADKQQTQSPQVKPTANKQQAQSPQVKPTANKQPAQSPQVKPTANKQQAQNCQAKPNTKSVTVSKPQVQKSQIKPAQRQQEKNVVTKKPDLKSKPSKPERKSYKNRDDDFEELDDYDILALMSEGIVLDECSGSDEE